MQKVYVIEPPTKKRPSQATRTQRPEPKRPSRPSFFRKRATLFSRDGDDSSAKLPAFFHQQVNVDATWRAVLIAYFAAPAGLAMWTRGNRRIVWMAICAVTLIAGVLMAARQAEFLLFLDAHRGGALIWLLSVALTMLSISTIWARALGAISDHHTNPRDRLPGWMCNVPTMALLGTLIPGFGFIMSGRSGRAAVAFWTAGVAVTATVVLARWSWLWSRVQAPVSAGMTPYALEATLLVTTAVAAGAFMLWITQGLDGSRFTVLQGSHHFADAIGAALVISVIALVTTSRPARLAENLHSAAVVLRDEGMRLIPLKLCEVSVRLDPARPIYTADAADLDEALGMTAAAKEKRDLLASRLNEHLMISRRSGLDVTQNRTDDIRPEDYYGRFRHRMIHIR